MLAGLSANMPVPHAPPRGVGHVRSPQPGGFLIRSPVVLNRGARKASADGGSFRLVHLHAATHGQVFSGTTDKKELPAALHIRGNVSRIEQEQAQAEEKWNDGDQRDGVVSHHSFETGHCRSCGATRPEAGLMPQLGAMPGRPDDGIEGDEGGVHGILEGLDGFRGGGGGHACGMPGEVFRSRLSTSRATER